MSKAIEINLPRKKIDQLKVINSTENNVVYFRPQGYPVGATFHLNNVRIEEDFCEIPTMSTWNGMKVKKEYGFYLQDGTFKRYTDPVFIKLESIVI